MKAADLFERDREKRTQHEWPRGASIPPEMPTPQTIPECVARRLLREYAEADDLMFSNLGTLHVYNVHELLERAYSEGRDEAIDATPAPTRGRPSNGYVVVLLTVGQAREALDALDFRLETAHDGDGTGWDPRGRAAAKRAVKRLGEILK